jgi:ABC-type nitrate/sulfonate/bicarbonate transport system permease component
MWQASVTYLHVSEYLLPEPIQVARIFVGEFRDVILPASVDTAAAIVAGLLFGLAFSFGAAILVDLYRPLRNFAEPILIGSQIMPKVALTPIILIWFGFGIGAKITMAAIVCFYPVYAGITEGIREIDQEIEIQASILGVSKLYFLIMVRLPLAMPAIAAGVRSASLLAVIGVIVTEFLASEGGVGYMVVERWGRSDTAGAFAGVVAVFIIGAIIFYATSAIMTYTVRALRLNVVRV